MRRNSGSPATKDRRKGRRDRGATLPEYTLILAGLVIATVLGAQVLEAGADKNVDEAAVAVGRMCHVDIYLDCVDASFATTTTAAPTTTSAPGGSGTTSTTSTSTSTTTTSTVAPSSSTTSTSPPSTTTTSPTSSTSTPNSTSTTSSTTTTTVPAETSKLVVQKRPLLDSSLWRPRARFWVDDKNGNHISGAVINATVTYLNPDGSVHAVFDAACTTGGTAQRCNINMDLYAVREITTVWRVSVQASPNWDGSNAEFTMDWQSS